MAINLLDELAEDISEAVKKFLKNFLKGYFKNFLKRFLVASSIPVGVREKIHLFKPVLDEEEIAECFYGMYVNCARFGQNVYDKLQFSTFLYYLLKDSFIISDNFNQTSFYQFVQKKVFYGLNQNVRTFNNRVTELKMLDEAVKHPKDYERNPDFCYFRYLKKKFRYTDFFSNLEQFYKEFKRSLERAENKHTNT